jgi:hypothetical protein
MAPVIAKPIAGAINHRLLITAGHASVRTKRRKTQRPLQSRNVYQLFYSHAVHNVQIRLWAIRTDLM